MVSAADGTEEDDNGFNIWDEDVANSKAELEELLPRFMTAVIRAIVLMEGSHGRAEHIASMWKVTHKRMRELGEENKRLKALLAQHGIDPESAVSDSA